MHGLEFILAYLAVATALVPIARRFDVPFPIALVVTGLGLAFVPQLPQISVDPEIAFVLFVPPLLYRAAFTTSLRDFRRDLVPIGLLAFGGVIVTTAAVACAARVLLPSISWAAAVVLGAIVAPPDAAVATAVAKRLGVSRRLVTVLEGETLMNDVTAFVTYRYAVAAVVTGAFSWASAGGRFVVLGVGGVAVGLGFAWVIAKLRRAAQERVVDNTISLLTPFAIYLPAEAIGVSGVLAVVTAGLALGRGLGSDLSPRMRVQAQAMWNVVEFLLDGLIFLLIGLELGRNVRGMDAHSAGHLLWLASAVSAVVVVVRIVWVFATAYAPRVLEPPADRKLRWRSILLLAWTGMRGGDSLVTALALPLVVDDGGPFPQRETLVAISFGVIVTTLVLQGLTLRPLVRWLDLPPDPSERKEEIEARRRAADAAMKQLDGLCTAKKLPPSTIERLRAHFTLRAKQDLDDLNEELVRTSASGGNAFREIELAMLAAQRETVVRLRDEGAISDGVLRKIQSDLDLEALRIDGQEEEDL